MSENKYHFMSYIEQKNGVATAVATAVSKNMHPFNMAKFYNFVLLSYQEITEEEYDIYITELGARVILKQP